MNVEILMFHPVVVDVDSYISVGRESILGILPDERFGRSVLLARSPWRNAEGFI